MNALDGWVRIARYLVDHAQYTAGQKFCSFALEQARCASCLHRLHFWGLEGGQVGDGLHIGPAPASCRTYYSVVMCSNPSRRWCRALLCFPVCQHATACRNGRPVSSYETYGTQTLTVLVRPVCCTGLVVTARVRQRSSCNRPAWHFWHSITMVLSSCHRYDLVGIAAAAHTPMCCARMLHLCSLQYYCT